MRKTLGARGDFLLLALLATAVNIPLWSSAVWPQHDTVYAAQMFYAFYNEFFHHGHIARWLPFGTYGIPSIEWQITILTPASYLMGLLGKCFAVQDAYLLFKFTVLFEQLLFLAGIHLLSRELFRHRAAVFFTSLAAVLSNVWLPQLYWNFRIFYLLPFVFYFLLRFVQEKKACHLWLAGIVFVLSHVGNNHYFAPLNLWITIFFFIPFAVKNRKLWRHTLTYSASSIGTFLLMVFTAFLYLYFTSHALDGLSVHTTGRDPVTRTAPLEAFLTHGANIGPKKFWGLLYAGITGAGESNVSNDHTLYTGIVSLLFIVYAALRSRYTAFVSTVLVSTFLIMLSLGRQTPVATLAHHLPLMPYFRYIGQVGGVIRLFLILAAGFGLEAFLSDLEHKKDLRFSPKKLLAALGFCLLVGMIFLDRQNLTASFYPREWPDFYYFTVILAGITLFFLCGPSASAVRTAGIAACVCLTIDLLSYQNLAAVSWPYQWPWVSTSVTHVHDYRYQENRSLNFDTDKRAGETDRVVGSNQDRLTVESYSFMLFDPCISDYFTLVEGSAVEKLVRLRGPSRRDRHGLLASLNNPGGASFLRAVGCGYPKLRLVSDYVFTQNQDEAERLVSTLPNFDQKVVLENVPVEFQATPETAKAGALGHLRVISFNFNEIMLEAEVTHNGPVWLYYADAFHPGWRAVVNGNRAPIAQANIAFKAIPLQPGKNVVRFSFSNGLLGWAGNILALLATAFAVLLAALAVRYVSISPEKYHD